MRSLNFYAMLSGLASKKRNLPKHLEPAENFGVMGLNLVHDLSSSITALLLDIERLRLDSQAIEQSIQTARSHIAGHETNRINIGAEIRRCMADFSARCEEKNIKLSAVISQECTIEGSPSKLQIVLNNLVRNAIDAVTGHTGSWVQIRLYQIDQKIIIEVADNGRGIPLKRQRQIFSLGQTSKPLASHLGAGLVLVKRIVEHHFSGRVQVDSNPHGSCFRIIIPGNSHK